MKNLKYTIIFFLLLACNNLSLINSSDIFNISVIENSSEKVVFSLNDKEKIKSFVKKINEAKKEVRKFYALYTIEITYKNGGKDLILVNSKYFKLNGLTYSLSNDVIGLLY